MRKFSAKWLHSTKWSMFFYLFLVQGIRDLFWLPIEQYQKDGRIVRGLQRGANSFTTSTAMAALELTNRLVQAIQVNNNWPYCNCFIHTSCTQRTCIQSMHIFKVHSLFFCIL